MDMALSAQPVGACGMRHWPVALTADPSASANVARYPLDPALVAPAHYWSKEGQMLSQRNTHYWLWFLLFGVVSALVTASKGEGITIETMWLLIAGFVGLVLGTFLPSLARPFDLVIGLLFTAVGLLGILHNFGLNLTGGVGLAPNAIDDTAILGLSLSLPYALIHTVLGLTSLSHGLRARVATSRVAVATPAMVE